MHITENVPLSSLTTFRTGGPARFLISCDSAAELPEAAAFADAQGLPVIPLGGGSNMLAPDEGVPAVFVRLADQSISVDVHDAMRVYTIAAGAVWDALVARTVSDDAWGIENLSAIPGTVGAAAVQNIGAYGAALSDTLVSVAAFDMHTREFVTFGKTECNFGYRRSIFKEARDRYFVTALTLSLTTAPRPNLSYRDLMRRFENQSPSLAEIREAVIAIRAEKFPPLSEYGTAGSFFLNPIVSEDEATALKRAYPAMPFFELPEGGMKAPLGWLFDHALALHGMREGKAFVWDKQALVIAAESGATAHEIKTLSENISFKAKTKLSLTIVPEVRIL